MLFSISTFVLKEMSMDVIVSFFQKLKSKTDFKVRYNYYELFLVNYPKIWYTKEVVLQVLMLSPLYIVAFFLQYKKFQKPKLSFFYKYLGFFIAVLSCLSPLFLGLIGYDLSRWILLTIFNSFIIFYLYKEQLKHYAKYISICLIVFCAIGNLTYFDKKFPRLQNLTDFSVVIKNLKESLTQRPEKY